MTNREQHALDFLDIKPDHFEIKENGACFLNGEGKKVFLTAWQKRKQEMIRHRIAEKYAEQIEAMF